MEGPGGGGAEKDTRAGRMVPIFIVNRVKSLLCLLAINVSDA